MRLVRRLCLMTVLTGLLVACGTPSTTGAVSPVPSAATALPAPSPSPMATPTPPPVKPGEPVGDATLIAITPAPTDYIEGMTDSCPGNQTPTPGVSTVNCFSSTAPVRWLGIGWSNTTAQLMDSDWSHMEWKASLDGHDIELPSFGTFDQSFSDLHVRIWNIALKNPPARVYTLHVIQVIKQDLKENDTTYPAGTYDTTFHVTLVKGA